jgi:hypothetical protein
MRVELIERIIATILALVLIAVLADDAFTGGEGSIAVVADHVGCWGPAHGCDQAGVGLPLDREGDYAPEIRDRLPDRCECERCRAMRATGHTV